MTGPSSRPARRGLVPPGSTRTRFALVIAPLAVLLWWSAGLAGRAATRPRVAPPLAPPRSLSLSLDLSLNLSLRLTRSRPST